MAGRVSNLVETGIASRTTSSQSSGATTGEGHGSRARRSMNKERCIAMSVLRAKVASRVAAKDSRDAATAWTNGHTPPQGDSEGALASYNVDGTCWRREPIVYAAKCCHFARGNCHSAGEGSRAELADIRRPTGAYSTMAIHGVVPTIQSRK